MKRKQRSDIATDPMWTPHTEPLLIWPPTIWVHSFSFLLSTRTEVVNHLPRQSGAEKAQRGMVEEHKNNDISARVCVFVCISVLSFRKLTLLLKIIKHAYSSIAGSYPRLRLFIMNYMVVIYLYQMFKKLARLMKNAWVCTFVWCQT